MVQLLTLCAVLNVTNTAFCIAGSARNNGNHGSEAFFVAIPVALIAAWIYFL